MNTYNYLKRIRSAWRTPFRLLSSSKANVLVYLIVVVLIFGVLGVTIVSLFTTATTSSATPNDSRRAYYVAESGIRYALSQIRNSNFNDNFIQSLNNMPSYKLSDGGSFWINVFSPWFEYTSISGSDLTLEVPNAGKIPENFSIPNITLINWNDFRNSPPNPPPPDSWEPITGSLATSGNTSLTITVANPADFTVGTTDIVCLAVQPTNADPASPLQAGEGIYVTLDAQDVFPPGNGAIRIVTNDGQLGDYYYQELIPDIPNNRARLTNLAALPGTTFTQISDFSTDDWVVLSLNNYRLLATGKSGDVEITIGDDKPLNIFSDVGSYTIYESELIADRSVKEWYEVQPVIQTDTVEDKITLGGPGRAFGDLWYGGEKPIGGDSNFCQEGRCLFGDGIRAFFTLDVEDSFGNGGEGFIFAIIAGGPDSDPENTRDSAGGDFERSELLGYAGDSRIDAVGTSFVDNYAPKPPGLLPPKFGFEFDTRTNYDLTFEQSFTSDPGYYCASPNSLKVNTRNDPLPGPNPHTVQNVFWGNTVLNVICRPNGNDATYDDNRHDAEDFREKWPFDTPTGSIISSPAIDLTGGPHDGTIYVGSNDGHLYAVNPDGSPKWQAPDVGSVGAVNSSPAIADDGTIYVGSDDGHLYAVDPDDGSLIWQFPSAGSIGAVRSSPAIGSDGTIYVGATNGNVYAINPDGSPRGLNWPYAVGSPVISSPAIDLTGGPNDGTIYIGAGDQGIPDDGRLIAINPDGTQKWVFLAEAGAGSDDDMDSSPAVGADGTIYIGSDDDNLYAVNPNDHTKKWKFPTIGDVESRPAISESDATVYVESESIRLYALNVANGSQKWQFILGLFSDDADIESSPTLDSDGNVYIGSKGGEVRAINKEDGSLRWQFPTGNIVRSTPAINPRDKTVYVGSNDTNFYAFNQLAEPRNFRDESVEDKKLIISDDFPAVTFSNPNQWLKEGPWAVRMEVTRVPGTEGPGVAGTYTLKTWVEKCNGDCTAFLAGFFRDTRIEYDVAARPPKLEQTLILSDTDHQKFERFLFGFTTAAGAGDTQQAVIKDFELSFIQPSDIVITSD
jgi:outer membrane protein assembly factor BamB